MISLHFTHFYSFKYWELALILNNVVLYFLSIFFFIYLLYTVAYSFLSNNQYTSTFKNIFIFKYWLTLIFLWVLFIFKIYLSTVCLNLRFFRTTIYLIYSMLPTNINIFGDTLILLCITTLMISWVFLSERYIALNSFSNFYFFIFIIFTANMVYADNLLVMFIFFEFIFLPSLFFVYILGYAKKVEKTIKYLLVWTLTGSFISLCGLVYLYSVTSNLSLSYLKHIQLSFSECLVLYFVFFIGFGLKIPLWPFHYWLTKVHVEAPTGFSIFLSGYLVKTALFCLIHFISLFKTDFTTYISTAWVLWGCLEASFRMWSATDIKRLIAFATIQEMNLIVLLSLLTTSTYYRILNSFILVHGLLSALLFFLVDQIQKRSQTRNLTTLSGFAYKLTFLPVIIWIAILIFRGFPIFSKFIIEWEILTLLYENLGVLGIFFFFMITLAGVLGFCRIWFTVLYGQPSNNLTVSTDLLKIDKLIALYIISLLVMVSTLMLYLTD